MPGARSCEDFVSSSRIVAAGYLVGYTAWVVCDVVVLVGDSLHFALDSAGELGSATDAQEIILVRSVHRVMRRTACDREIHVLVDLLKVLVGGKSPSFRTKELWWTVLLARSKHTHT